MALWYQTAPENFDKVVQSFQKQAVPLVSHQPRFKGIHLLTRPTGEFMVLNIWDTEQQANAWPQNPQHQQVAKQLKPFILNHAIDKLKD